MKYMMNIYVIYSFNVNNEVLYLYTSWKHRSEGWATHLNVNRKVSMPWKSLEWHNPHMASSQKSPLKSDENTWLGISMVYLWYIYGISMGFAGIVLSWNSAKSSNTLKTSQNAQFHAIASFCSAKSEEKISLLNFSPVMIWSETMNLGASVSVETETLKIFTLALSAQFNEEPANEVGNMAAGHQGEAVMNFHTSRVKNSPRAQPK